LTGLEVSITIFFDNTGGTLASLTNPKVTISAVRGAPGITTSGTEPQDTTVLWNDPTDIAEPFVIPAGGIAGQLLSKVDAADYNTEWADPIPTGGTAGQVLAKVDGSSFNTEWVDKDSTFPVKLNEQTITENYTVPIGYNGLSAGPITIADGVTVIVSSGSGWSIV
jgi:hypothetical protein